MPRLVLVNDDPTQLAVAAGLLGKDGCEVVRFLSSPEALEACRSLTADVVVSDLNMPDLRGDELLVALRQLPAYAQTPVILVSASEPRPEIRAVCAPLLEGRGTLLAPYRLPELRRLVKVYLEGGSPEPAPDEVPPVAAEFDPEPVKKLLETGGPAFAAKIVGMFLTKVPANLDALETTQAQGDWPTAERLAHSTRGSAGIVGALLVGTLAGECEEKAARQESFSLLPVRTAFEAAKARLEKMLP